MRLATTSAPDAISGWSRTSSFRNHVSPRESSIVKPGDVPSLLLATITHCPSAGPVCTIDVVSSGSTTGRGDIRLVNQLESGTSSIVVTLRARTFGVGSPGALNCPSTIAHARLTSRATTREASSVSSSRPIGSSA
jgi:hypothetical protein